MLKVSIPLRYLPETFPGKTDRFKMGKYRMFVENKPEQYAEPSETMTPAVFSLIGASS
jgi:hypothetical protein